jgi:hypothetical protein
MVIDNYYFFQLLCSFQMIPVIEESVKYISNNYVRLYIKISSTCVCTNLARNSSYTNSGYQVWACLHAADSSQTGPSHVMICVIAISGRDLRARKAASITPWRRVAVPRECCCKMFAHECSMFLITLIYSGAPFYCLLAEWSIHLLTFSNSYSQIAPLPHV